MYSRKRSRGRRYGRRVRRKPAFARPPNFGAGTSTAKKVDVVSDSTASNLNSRTMVRIDLSDISHTSTNEADERQRNLVNLRGFKVCLEVTNNQDTMTYFNWAIIQRKPAGATPAGTNVTGFFRNNNSQTRSVNFGGVLSGLEYHCLPINTDNYYVMCHKRVTLAPLASSISTTDNKHQTTYVIDKYIPYKRQIRFDSDFASSPGSGEVDLVYWCSRSNSGNQVAQTSTVTLFRRVMTYFREPK